MRAYIIVFLWMLSAHAEAWTQVYHIIPEPTDMTIGNGLFEFNAKTVFVADEVCQAEAQWFVSWFNHATGSKCILVSEDQRPTENFVLFRAAKKYDPAYEQPMPKLPGNLNQVVPQDQHEDYTMQVDSRGIIMSSPYNTGVFYACQTLRQMLPPSAESGLMRLPVQLTCVTIRDKPAFHHRGMLLDCCRHFMSADFVKRYIDLLALYKMNVLHWHLTEDQGWRIQIDAYPELTKIGAWRTEADGTKHGGFYTKDQIREIVAYASARNITIIPEIELPGHSVAAIASYPWLSCTQNKIEVENEWGVFKDIYCAGNDSTIRFLEQVLTEVCDLFPSKYIHIGGDEAPKFRWENCAKCQNRMKVEGLKDEAELQTWFIEHIAAFLKTKDKDIIGWDEILEGGIPSSAAIQSWRGMDGGVTAAKAGHDVVMSPTSHCYFDYGLESTDLREVYTFDPIPDGLSNMEKQHILGAECNLWSEHAPQELVDSKVFPRILAMSEILWRYPEQRYYDRFFQRVMIHYERLDQLGVDVGFPEVPAKVTTEMKSTGEMIIVPQHSFQGLQLTVEGYGKDQKMQTFPTDQVITTRDSMRFEIKAKFRNKTYDKPITRLIDPHLGAMKKLTLGYEPSPYYKAGGLQALADGCLGTANFRDGYWQAVQGQNMEVMIDLGEFKKITQITSHFYHYANAWIFRPSHVVFYISKDGNKWTSVQDISATMEDKTPGELIVPFSVSIESTSCRYVKMVAYNNGVCPEWHDAPGEPSWLFCDELIVK